MIGKTVGNYKIIENIGEGGFGIVYKGIHRFTGKRAAIKTILPSYTNDPKFKERFYAEAKIQDNLHHNNIVVMHDFLEVEDRYFIIMELLEGMDINGKRIRTLADLINIGPIPEEKIFDIFKQIILGIGYAHRQMILHRDIKPGNMLFNKEGEVKISDFGIAKIVAGDTRISVSGSRVGTPRYMSPEQILNEQLDKRSDIYSLGITLHEMATGKSPFRETSQSSSIEKQHIKEPPLPARKLNSNVSQGLEKIILKALEKEREDRFQTCEEFLSALEKIRQKPLTGVPLLIGQELEEAKEILDNSDLKFVFGGEEWSEEIPEGFIMRQEPRGGARVVKDSEVKLFVSKGEKSKIEKTVKEKIRPSDETVKEKSIPVAEATVKEKVSPVVKKVIVPVEEKPVIEKVTVPDLYGLDFNNAKTILKKMILNIRVIDKEYSKTVFEGFVLRQNPIAGASLEKGETVKVILSKGEKKKKEKIPTWLSILMTIILIVLIGIILYFNNENFRGFIDKTYKKVKEIVNPEPVTMPQLIGLSIFAAEDTIKKISDNRSLNLEQKKDSIFSDSVKKDYVINYTPDAETELFKNNTIKITYCCGQATCHNLNCRYKKEHEVPYKREWGDKGCPYCGTPFD